MRGKILITALVAVTQQSFGNINLQQGSLIKSWTDLRTPNFKFTRTYSSRNLSQGLFGKSWCSSLDIRLEMEQQNIALESCTHRQLFLKELDSWKHLNRAVFKTASGYTLIDGDLQTLFNAEGELTGWISRNGHTQLRRTTLDNSGSSRWKIKSPLGAVAELTFSKGLLVQASLGRQKWIYVYSDRHLIRAEAPLQQHQQFRYDERGKLSRIDFEDGSHESFAYNHRSDRVISSIRRDNCFEHYEYVAEQPERLISSATESCQGRTRKLVKMVLNYRFLPTGAMALVKATIERDETRTEFFEN